MAEWGLKESACVQKISLVGQRSLDAADAAEEFWPEFLFLPFIPLANLDLWLNTAPFDQTK